MTTRIGPAAAPSLDLRHNRAFFLLWFGEGVSLLGSATTSMLLPLMAVLAFDAGPGWMGLLAAATWLPWLVVGLPAGAWVDRRPPRPVMIAADLAAAAALFSVPVAWRLGVLSLPQLLVVALLTGTATVFFRTAYPRLLTGVVPADQLESANARLFGTESAVQITGPGLGGLLAQAFSAAYGLLIDAVTFLVSACCLWRIRPEHAAPPAPSPPTSLTVQIREGIEFVQHDRYLSWLTVIGSVSNFGLVGYQALLVLHLVRDLGLSELGVGVVVSLGAAGGLVGAAAAPRVAARLGSGRASTVLLLLGGPPALLIAGGAVGWRTGLVVLGLFVVGVCVVAGNVIRGAWRQRYVPSELMGRVITTSQFVNYGSMPLAAITSGWLAGTVGIRETIAIMAAVHALACLAIVVSPFRALRDLPLRQPRQ